MVLVVLLLLSVAPVAWAGPARVAFDFPVPAYPDVAFMLRSSQTDASGTHGAEQPLTLLASSVCPQAAQDEGWITVCADLCLAQGAYVFQVYAKRGSALSALSNEFAFAVGDPTPCPGTPLPPAPPRPPRGRPPQSPTPPRQQEPPSPAMQQAMANAAAVLTAAGLTVAQSASGLGSTLPNPGCVSWAVTGPCFCTPVTPCLSVEYWEPGWLVETVKTPGTTALPLLQDLLDVALRVSPTSLLGGGGAGTTSGSGHTNLHYTEAHVWTFPQVLGGPCTGCAPTPGLPFSLHYASELDPVWRDAVAAPVSILARIGTWAPLFPRAGFVVHGSPTVASGVAATRAMSIAFLPLDPPPGGPHPVVQPIPALSTCCQLAFPRMTPCFTPGTPPLVWDHAAVSLRGSYIWIFWRKRTCCVPPNQITCGITLPGVGAHGQNGCVLPPPPSP